MADSIMQMGADSTMMEYVENYSSEELTNGNLYFQQVFKDKQGQKIIVNDQSIMLRYLPEFLTIKKKYTFTDLEYRKYRFNPKRLSYDLYGTTELWSVILGLNELISTVQFDLRTVYVFPSYVVERIKRMLTLEEENKNYNAEELSEALFS